jgi:hypothetical protein
MSEALLCGKDPGRAAAQGQALELLQLRSTETRGWWRFEGTSMVDCVLMSPELVVTIEGKRTDKPCGGADPLLPPVLKDAVRNHRAP